MSWKPGDSGWATGTMAGGPFDGKTYGDLPISEAGDAPSRIFIPRETDSPDQVYSTYDRQSSSPEGTWLYVFAGDIVGSPANQPGKPDELPIGTSIRFAQEVTPPDVEEMEEVEEPATSLPALEPARRFVLAQSWWIASELCRRHPSRRVYEMHPGGGQYDVLRVWGPGRSDVGKSAVLCDLNRAGSLHLADDADGLSWGQVLAAESPHEIVKRIEQVGDDVLPGKAPSTTPTSLTYRVAARLLATRVDDRARWDIRMEFLDSSGYGGGPRRFVDVFPSAQQAMARAGERLTAWDPGEHFWGVLRNEKCVAVLDDAGVLHVRAGAIELMPIYRRRRRLQDVMAEVFAGIG